jgi:predicted nucleic acid-binding protein
VRPIVIDATTLSILLNPSARLPIDPATNAPVDLGRERILGFIAQVEKERRKLVIPTPVTAELLTAIGPTSADYIRVINRKAVFEVRSFDEVAAVELAFLNRDIFASLDQKNGLEPWQKMKVDRQILAIAKVADCEKIMTEDNGLANRARLCGIEPISIKDLPIPDSAKQGELKLEDHEEIPAVDKDNEADETNGRE